MKCTCENQISLFDFLTASEPLVPKFQKEQKVYIVSLDVVLCGKVEDYWKCNGLDNEKPYLGYSVIFEQGYHTTFWDYNVGNTVFSDNEEATSAAKSRHYDKINPVKIEIRELLSCGYRRECDNHLLTATIGMIGDRQIYEHEFYCYHFIRTYPTQNKRDKEFQKLLKKVNEEAKENNCFELEKPALETLYKVNDELYASREYTEFHMRLKY